ncbi:MAG: leucine-rich repeat protein, partial [Clostridia bacterium]|nr:leucine-rich repeat protein [Clostridia bacterium]
MKKILSILCFFALFMTIILSLSITSFAAEATTPAAEETTILYSGACGTNLTWQIDDTGTLTIDGTGAMETYSAGSAPWYAYRTQITSCAFQYCTNVLNVTIGNSTTTIGIQSFAGLKKVNAIIVPDSVTTIGSGAFNGCSSLKEITLPFVGSSRNRYYNHNLFGYIFGTDTYTGGKKTTQYYLNNGEQSVEFYIPTSLTKVTITDASSIYYGAFSNCSEIVELNLNDEITNVEDYAFYNLGMIKKSTNDFVVSGKILLSYKGASTQIAIPDGIRIIAPRAFYNNKNIGTITLDDDTSYIGAYAFYNCTSALVNVPRISGTLNIESNGFTNTASVKYLDKSSYTNGNDTYYYTVDSEGNAIIVGCSTTSTNITLPNTLGGYTVTTVGYKGMANCTTLTGVTIPNNIVKLDLYAFAGCTGLDTATIPATCVYVGQYAFSGCTSLTTVVIAEGVTYLGDYCFENCTSLTEIVVPDSCTYLGDYAFYNCVSMESATIGITVPAIGKYTFYNCEKLATVVIGIKVESIGEYAFYNTALTRLTTPNALKHIDDYAFASCEDLTRASLKTGLLTIGDGAFMGDVALTTINWTANINSIGAYAFHGCSSLASATIPAGVTEIKDYTFAYCTSLASVTVKGTLTSIGEKAFYRDALTAFTFTEGLTTIGADAFAFNALEVITLPNSLVYIGEQAFNECSSLASVSMPDSVAYVGAYAFSADADNLTVTIRYNSGKIADYMLYNMDVYKVVMEDGISEIGNYVFALCHELTEITFPNTLKTIGNYAFYDNRMYDELTLPNTVETIGDYTFARGYRFIKINIPDSVQSIGTHAFMRAEAINHIDPEFTVHFYYNKGILCDNILDGQDMHHIIVADYIHTVGNNAFSNATNLMDISLPDTIASFGDNCFQNDTNIIMTIRTVDGLIDNNVYNAKLDRVITVNLDDSNVGDYAFAANPGLLNLTIAAISESFDMTSIGSHAFDGCKSMGAVVLPTTVNYIGSYAFYDCNSMSSINIPNGIEKILSHTFYGCASLGSIEVPNSVIAIEDYAFYGCIVATYITLSNQCQTIGEAAFYNCKALTELNIPDSVTSIGAYAFRSCSEITELVFSDNVDKIGACAFYDCNGLKTVKLGKKIIELGDRMFYGCVNLESLYVYAPLSYIDELAFYGAEDVSVYCGRDDYMINFFDENGIFYEILDDLVYEYKITFVTDNGEIISSATYTSGSTVTPPTNPTKSADNTYTYAFIGWDQEITVVGGNKTYTASFTPVYIDYTVVFKDYNGNTISSGTYHYGDTVTAPSDPTRAADNTYTYAFAGWNNAVVECAGNTTYTATYTSTYIEYTVEFKDFDGQTISKHNYHYGDNLVIPEAPDKSEDDYYSYEFLGWDINNDGGIDAIPFTTSGAFVAMPVYSNVCKHFVTYWVHLESGMEHYICNNCFEILNARDGHLYSEFVPQNLPDCINGGNIGYYSCECGALFDEDYLEVESVLVEALGHDMAPATCTEASKCKRTGCNHTVGTALGHSWSKATCTAPKTCSVCDATEGEALGHNFTNYVSNGDATCTVDGTKTAECTRCDETDTVTDTNSKLGHDMAPATCTEASKCKRVGCNHTVGSALGHTWVNATCTVPKTCSVCDATEGEALGHNFTNYVSNGDATCTVDGTKTAE